MLLHRQWFWAAINFHKLQFMKSILGTEWQFSRTCFVFWYLQCQHFWCISWFLWLLKCIELEFNSGHEFCNIARFFCIIINVTAKFLWFTLHFHLYNLQVTNKISDLALCWISSPTPPKLKAPFLSQPKKNLISDLKGVGSQASFSVVDPAPHIPQVQRADLSKIEHQSAQISSQNPYKVEWPLCLPSLFTPPSNIKRFTVQFQEKCDLEKAHPALEILWL